MIRAIFLSLCGCASVVATLAGLAHRAPSPSATRYEALPLHALPVIRDGRLRGVSFVRVAATASVPKEVDAATWQAFMADAIHDATLGAGALRDVEGATLVDADLFKASLSVHLARAGAPFRLSRALVVQSEYRPSAALRTDGSAR